MESVHIELSENTMAQWVAKIASRREVIKQQKSLRGALWSGARSELKVYGIALAHARMDNERAKGNSTARRAEAAKKFFAAFEAESDLLRQIENGDVNHAYTYGMPQALKPAQERLEDAERRTDEALLDWCAE